MEKTTLSDFLLIYEQFASSDNRSKRSIESVLDAVSKFDIFLGGCADPKIIRAEDLRTYIRYLQQKSRWAGHPTIKKGHGNLSPYSIASYVRSIRSFWSWLALEKFIDYNPFVDIKPPKVPYREVSPLTPAEVTKEAIVQQQPVT